MWHERCVVLVVIQGGEVHCARSAAVSAGQCLEVDQSLAVETELLSVERGDLAIVEENEKTVGLLVSAVPGLFLDANMSFTVS